MGARIAVTGIDPLAMVTAGEPSTGLTVADWQRIEQGVGIYLHALGVTDPEALDSLRQQVLRRVEARVAVRHLGEPLEAAISDAHLLLDQWLVSELGLEGDADALSAARAAVLGGHVPGWGRRWAGLTQDSLAERIQAARISAVPERAPLSMEPNPIRLCCHRLLLRLLARLARLFGLRGRRLERTGGAQ